jgi:hypothetical protein
MSNSMCEVVMTLTPEPDFPSSPDQPLLILKMPMPHGERKISWGYAKVESVQPTQNECDECSQPAFLTVLPARPNDIMTDGTMEAYMDRIEGHERLLISRGFQKSEALALLMSGDPESKEPVAHWLRSELKNLRDGEKTIGAAPSLKELAFRKQEALTRSVITDMTFTLLENIDGSPGRELLCLLQELMNVDRHRKELAISKVKWDQAANLEAKALFRNHTYGLKELARAMSISSSTASMWKKSTAYQNRIQYHKQKWADFLGVHKEHSPGMLEDIESKDWLRARWEQTIKIMECVWRLLRIAEFLERLETVSAFVRAGTMQKWSLRPSAECSYYHRRAIEQIHIVRGKNRRKR